MMNLNEIISRRERRVQNTCDSNLISSIKMKVILLIGKNDLEAYLEWKRKVEHVFNLHNYSEEEKSATSSSEIHKVCMYMVGSVGQN